MPVALSRAELVALTAAMFATIAFSLDAMLPALPDIGGELAPADPNRAGLVLTFFVLGLGLGTFVAGPLSDAIGRKPVILGGAVLFILAAGLAWAGPTLGIVLAARMLQGLAAAAPRVVALAVLRDCFAGRIMARIMSFVMMVFTLVPAIAPLLGSFVIAGFGWRGIFIAFMIFMALIGIWVLLRLPETLKATDRRPLRVATLRNAVVEMAAHPVVRLSILVQALSMGALFSALTLVQPVYDRVFDRADVFPYWFGAVAIVAGSGGLINAALVVRVGMRRMVSWTFLAQILVSSLVLGGYVLGLAGTALFYVFVLWQVGIFLMAALTIGNLNAIAMEPMGHIAGLAASAISGIGTVLAAPIATLVGLSFDGTIVPLVLSVLILSSGASVLMQAMARAEAGLAVAAKNQPPA
ncbi:MAG: MFS transporter [Marinibacterium sp.]